MIVKLLPDQIAEYWDLLKIAILKALPPVAHDSVEVSNNILHNLLAGGMDCWIAYSTDNGMNKPYIVATTTIFEDLCSQSRSLVVYTFFGMKRLTGKDWVDIFEVFSKYGRSRGCSRIIAYTNLEVVRKVARLLGGTSDVTLISIPF